MPSVEALALRLRHGGRFRICLVDHCVAALRLFAAPKAAPKAAQKAAHDAAAKALADWMEAAVYLVTNKTMTIVPADLDSQPTLRLREWIAAMVSPHNYFTRQSVSKAFANLYATYWFFLTECKAQPTQELEVICVNAAVNLADCLDSLMG